MKIVIKQFSLEFPGVSKGTPQEQALQRPREQPGQVGEGAVRGMHKGKMELWDYLTSFTVENWLEGVYRVLGECGKTHSFK